jgi:hypothetical protein
MGPRSASVIPSVEHLVTQALYRLRRLGDRVLADSGLRTWHFGVMPALDLYGPCPQQELARCCHSPNRRSPSSSRSW